MEVVKEVTGSRFFLHLRRPEEAKRFEYWIIEKGGIVSIFLDGTESAIVTDDPLYNKYRGKIVNYLMRHPTSQLFSKLPAPLREAVRAKVPIVTKDEFRRYAEKVDPRSFSLAIFPVITPQRSQEAMVPTGFRPLREPYLIVRDEDRKYQPLIFEPSAKHSSKKSGNESTRGVYGSLAFSKASRLSLVLCQRTNIPGTLKHKFSAAESVVERKKSRRQISVRHKVCKLCRTDFIHLKEHLESSTHRRMAQAEDTWKALAEVQDLCLGFDEFLQQLPARVKQERSEERGTNGSNFQEQERNRNCNPTEKQAIVKEAAAHEIPANASEKPAGVPSSVRSPNLNAAKELKAQESPQDVLNHRLLQRCIDICEGFEANSKLEKPISCSSQFEEVVKMIVNDFSSCSFARTA